jgi:23S rRNA (cytidine1920-2'-O)/16S rRNA (cytidine1409-2'-O)-methyltransferase
MQKIRLDLLLTQNGLAESREKAQKLIMAGQVIMDGRALLKAGALVSPEAVLSIVASLPYVSRGGLKLEAALKSFEITVAGRVAADVGASTGGFTDCLLQHGAARVYAIDVGYGQLAWTLRQDPRVVVMDRTNIRYLEQLPELVHLATVDVSFISLTLVLPSIKKLLFPDGGIVALVKPQFEAGRELVGRGGVVRDAKIHRMVLERIIEWSVAQQLSVRGLIRSPLKGPAGNIEFLVHLALQADKRVQDTDVLIELALESAANFGG